MSSIYKHTSTSSARGRNKKQEVAKVFEFSSKIEDIEFDIALMYNDSYEEKIYSFVNNIRTPNGGTHEAGFRAALTRAISKLVGPPR